MNSAFFKDIGGREEQQDAGAIFQLENQTFMVVADGMGGHKGGALASSTLLKIAENKFLFHNNSIKNSPRYFFDTIIEETKKELAKICKNDTIDPNTTVIFALIKNNSIYYAYIGDSRLYLFEKEKKLIFRTRDHSLPEMLFQDKQIEEKEISTHPQQNVLTKSIGIDSLDIAQYGEIKLTKHKEYRLMLASDGLWAMIQEKELYNELFSEKSLEVSTKKLLSIAKHRGGNNGDNISIATLNIKKKSSRKYLITLFITTLLTISIYLFTHQNQTSIIEEEHNSTEINQTKPSIYINWATG